MPAAPAASRPAQYRTREEILGLIDTCDYKLKNLHFEARDKAHFIEYHKARLEEGEQAAAAVAANIESTKNEKNELYAALRRMPRPRLP